MRHMIEKYTVGLMAARGEGLGLGFGLGFDGCKEGMACVLCGKLQGLRWFVESGVPPIRAKVGVRVRVRVRVKFRVGVRVRVRVRVR